VPLRYGVFDRYREISRNVRLKNGKCATWKPIGRAIPISDWDIRPPGYWPQHWHPAPDIWTSWDPTQARYQTFAIVADSHSGDYRGSRSISVRYEGKGRFIRLERWIHEVQWSAVPMCNPTRLIALPPARKPHGLIAPFTRPYWIPVPVKDYEVMAVKHYEVNEAMTIENREIRENQYPDLFSPQSNLSSSTQTEADMAVLKVPDQDWNTLAEIGRRPEHLRTAPQMANYVIRRGVLEEQMKFGRQLREEPK
jgi:hypothetical protein